MLVVADEINNTTSHYVSPWLCIVIRRHQSYVDFVCVMAVRTDIPVVNLIGLVS